MFRDEFDAEKVCMYRHKNIILKVISDCLMNYHNFNASMPQEVVSAQCKSFHKQKCSNKEKISVDKKVPFLKYQYCLQSL